MSEPTIPPAPSDQRAVLESIARTLLRGGLVDPAEDLGAWVAGVEVVEALRLAGFGIVRQMSMPSGGGPVPGLDGARHQRSRGTGPVPRGRARPRAG